MRAKDFIPASKPRNFVAKNSKTAGAGAHKDKKRADKQGDIKHKKQAIPMGEQGVAEDRLGELFEPSTDYYTLSNGKMVQVDYRPGTDGRSPAPLTDVKVSYVNPALKPQGPSFNSTGQAERWDRAPDGVKQAIQKFVTQPQSKQVTAEGIENSNESLQDYAEAGVCPICHGDMVSEEQIAEGKKDACYHKIKASSKVWPSAYASGRLVQCRKAGAANYGKGKKK